MNIKVKRDWDINDTNIPQVNDTDFDNFNEWSDGHVRHIYALGSEDAKKHISGWAMRNTNNHNVNILKKSCLGVLVCSKLCSLPNGAKINLRPAICDKARRKQEGKACPNRNCTGRLEIQPCRGHCGYPVTHFWRHSPNAIFFQAKGMHDHQPPEPKNSTVSKRAFGRAVATTTRTATKKRLNSSTTYKKETSGHSSSFDRNRDNIQKSSSSIENVFKRNINKPNAASTLNVYNFNACNKCAYSNCTCYIEESRPAKDNDAYNLLNQQSHVNSNADRYLYSTYSMENTVPANMYTVNQHITYNYPIFHTPSPNAVLKQSPTSVSMQYRCTGGASLPQTTNNHYDSGTTLYYSDFPNNNAYYNNCATLNYNNADTTIETSSNSAQRINNNSNLSILPEPEFINYSQIKHIADLESASRIQQDNCDTLKRGTSNSGCSATPPYRMSRPTQAQSNECFHLFNSKEEEGINMGYGATSEECYDSANPFTCNGMTYYDASTLLQKQSQPMQYYEDTPYYEQAVENLN